MNILEKFWYGNIEPAEYDTSSGKEYKELLQLISRNEGKLLATMTEDQKELFTKYADCVREYQVMAECLLFQNSFRLGGRMMLEVMRGGIGNPVMVATSGSALMKTDAVRTLLEKLLPLATLVTPNIPEAQVISGMEILTWEDMHTAAKKDR